MTTPEAAMEEGEIARHAANSAEAAVAFAKAADLYRAADDKAGLAYALTRQAQIARDQKRLVEAGCFQAEALALTREHGGRLAHVVRHMADILSETGRPGDAERLYAEMIGLYRADSETPPLEMANAVRSMARHAEAQGERELAITLWSEARARYATLDALFLEMIGSGENPGVREAERRLAALKA